MAGDESPGFRQSPGSSRPCRAQPDLLIVPRAHHLCALAHATPSARDASSLHALIQTLPRFPFTTPGLDASSPPSPAGSDIPPWLSQDLASSPRTQRCPDFTLHLLDPLSSQSSLTGGTVRFPSRGQGGIFLCTDRDEGAEDQREGPADSQG